MGNKSLTALLLSFAAVCMAPPAAGESAPVPFRLEARPEGVVFAADGPLNLPWPNPPAALRALLPPSAGALGLRLSALGDGPWSVTARRNGDGWRVATQLRLAVGTGAALTAEVEGAAEIGPQGVRRLDLGRLDVDARGLRPPFAAAADVALRLAGHEALTLHMLAHDLAIPGLAAAEAAFSGGGRLRVDGRHVAWFPDESARLWLEGLRLPGILEARSPIAVPLAGGGDGGAALEAALAPDNALSLRSRLRLGPLEAVALLPAADGAALRAAIPVATLDVDWRLPGGGGGAAFAFEGADLAVPDAGLEASGVRLRVNGGEVSLAAAALRRTADGRESLPLSVTALLRPGAAGTTVEGTVTGADGAIDGDFRGTAGAGTGDIAFGVAPVRFATEGLQPWHLLPELAGWVEELNGTVAVEGSVAWGDGAWRPRIVLDLQAVSVSRDDITAADLAGTVVLDGLTPPTTPPGQRLSVGAVQAPLPLDDGDVEFQLLPEGLRVERAEFRLAGGSVATEAVFLRPDPYPFDVPLEIRGVDMGDLAALLDIEGLTVTGTVEGRLPVVLERNALTVNDGHLGATGPGVIRYQPARPPAALAGSGYSEVLLRALSDFRYEDLTIDLDGRSGGGLVATIHIRGSNPDLYEGYPLEFNLNISGELEGLLARRFAVPRIPGTIREQESKPGAQ